MAMPKDCIYVSGEKCIYAGKLFIISPCPRCEVLRCSKEYQDLLKGKEKTCMEAEEDEEAKSQD